MIKRHNKTICLFILLIFFSCELPIPEDKSAPTTPPTTLSVSGGGEEGEVVVSWKSQNSGTLSNGEPVNVSIYTVEYSKQLNFANSNYLTVKGVSVKISDLDSRGTFYYFRVKANNTHIKNIQDQYSTPVRFKVGVTSSAIPPEEPSIPFIKEGTVFSRRATIYWIKAQTFGTNKDGVTQANFSKYELQYSLKNNFNNPSTKSIFTTESTFDLESLIPDSRYYIRIRTVSDSDDQLLKYSSWTYLKQQLVTHIASAEPPSPPKNIHLLGTTAADKATLEWTPPSNLGILENGTASAELLAYELQYSLSPNFAVDNKIIRIRSTGNSTTLKDLVPAVRYFVRIRAINNNSSDNFSKGAFSIPLRGGFKTQRPDNALEAEPPSIPSNISIENITETSVFIRWDAPYDSGKNKDGSESEVRKYIIEYATASDFSNMKRIDTSDTFLARELIALNVATLYYLRIKAVNDNKVVGLNTSITGSIFESFFTKKPIPPPKPDIILFKGNSPKTSIRVNWSFNGSGTDGDGAFSKIEKYLIEYSDNSFQTYKTIVVTNPLITFKQITGLTPFVKYYVRMKIVNNNRDNGRGIQNTSLPSDVKSLVTDSDSRKPLPPRDVNARVATPYVRGRRSIVVNWKSPADPGKNANGSRDDIKGYIIEYSRTIDFSDKAFVEVTNSEIRTFTIDGLNIDTSYFLRMKALNNNTEEDTSDSDGSNSVFISTNDNSLPPSPPKSVIASNVTNNSAQLNWKLPASFGENEMGTPSLIEGYEIRYAPNYSDIEDARWISRYGSDNISYKITSLRPNMKYRIEIRSLNSNTGLSKISIPISYIFTTLP